MNIFEELNWPQFQQLDYIKPLPLNEQVEHYSSYVYELSRNRYLYEEWLANQNRGPKPSTIQVTGVLLQEDLFDLQQEDGSQILITGYA